MCSQNTSEIKGETLNIKTSLINFLSEVKPKVEEFNLIAEKYNLKHDEDFYVTVIGGKLALIVSSTAMSILMR